MKVGKKYQNKNILYLLLKDTSFINCIFTNRACVRSHTHTRTLIKSWALSVFLNFFNNKKLS